MDAVKLFVAFPLLHTAHGYSRICR